MVRFSDMLGADGDADEPREPAGMHDEQPAVEEEPDPEPPPAPAASAEDVLARLTQYATSARAAERAADPVPPPDASEPDVAPSVPASEPAPGEQPAGDDLLPRGRRLLRKPKRD